MALQEDALSRGGSVDAAELASRVLQGETRLTQVGRLLPVLSRAVALAGQQCMQHRLCETAWRDSMCRLLLRGACHHQRRL
jgi:hypothetical protein